MRWHIAAVFRDHISPMHARRISLQTLVPPYGRDVVRWDALLFLSAADSDPSTRPPQTFGEAAALTRSAFIGDIALVCNLQVIILTLDLLLG